MTNFRPDKHCTMNGSRENEKNNQYPNHKWQNYSTKNGKRNHTFTIYCNMWSFFILNIDGSPVNKNRVIFIAPVFVRNKSVFFKERLKKNGSVLLFV